MQTKARKKNILSILKFYFDYFNKEIGTIEIRKFLRMILMNPVNKGIDRYVVIGQITGQHRPVLVP